MSEPVVILNPTALERALKRMAHEIAERNESSRELVLVGVQRGGVFLAARLGLPWYRPTRICHAVSGGDHGWRTRASVDAQWFR